MQASEPGHQGLTTTTKAGAELPRPVRAQRQVAFAAVLALSALLALCGMAVWLAVAFASTGIDPARYLREAALAGDRGEALLPWQLTNTPS